MIHNDEPSANRWLVPAALLLLTAIGLFLRLRHLGHLSLIVDEGFQAMAIKGILHHHGIPRLPSGEVYLRSPLFLYIQAAFAYYLGETAFALRLPAVLFGAACIPAAYLLGKQLFSRPVGLLLAAMIALSAWEIDLSRYARFYTAFQLTYIIAIVLFARGFLQHRPLSKIGFFIAAAVAISLHQLGIMLATCFLAFIPYPGLTAAKRWAWLGGAVSIAAIWVIFGRTLRAVSIHMARPLDGPFSAATVPPMAHSHHGLSALLAALPPLRPPVMRWFLLAMHLHPILLALAAIVPLLASVYLIANARAGRRWACLFLLGVVWSAYTGQAALLATFAIFYLALFVRDRHALLAPQLVVASVAAVFCLGGYGLWFLISPHIATRTGIIWMFRFPNYYNYFLQWFIPGWPVTCILFAGAVIYLARKTVTDDPRRSTYLILAGIFLPILITSELSWQFTESRYFFHLYPLILLAVACLLIAALKILRRRLAQHPTPLRFAVPVMVLLVIFFANKDLNPVKAYDIGSRQPASRTDPIRSIINWKKYAYFHQDLRSAAAYVRDHLKPGDTVLVVGPPHDAAVYRYYIGQVDDVLSSFYHGKPDDYTNAVKLSNGRYLDPVADALIIHSAAQLKHLVKTHRAHGLWILSDRIIVQPGIWFLSEPARKYLAKLIAKPNFIAADRQTVAVKVN